MNEHDHSDFFTIPGGPGGPGEGGINTKEIIIGGGTIEFAPNAREADEASGIDLALTPFMRNEDGKTQWSFCIEIAGSNVELNLYSYDNTDTFCLGTSIPRSLESNLVTIPASGTSPYKL